MISERPAEALSRFQGGMLCSQAILATYGPLFDLSEEDAVRIARGFGSGMARLSATCGAVSGAVMVIGLKYPGTGKQAKEDTYALIRTFSEKFQSVNGSLNCSELLGCDLATPEGQNHFRQNGLVKQCNKYVEDAAVLLEEMLELEK